MVEEAQQSKQEIQFQWFDRPLWRDWMWWYSSVMLLAIVLRPAFDGVVAWLMVVGIPIELRRARRRKRSGLPYFPTRGARWAIGFLIGWFIFAVAVAVWASVSR